MISDSGDDLFAAIYDAIIDPPVEPTSLRQMNPFE